MRIHLLHKQIASVCPIDGVSVVDKNDKSTWRIDFAKSATQQQIDDAQQVLFNYDVSNDELEEQIQKDRSYTITTSARIDPVIDKLRTATPQEIDQYIENNINDLSSAKSFLKKLAIGVAYAIRYD